MATSSEAIPDRGAGGRRVAVERLDRGSLSTTEVIAATLANIAPALGFYFSFTLIVGEGGLGSPLVIIAAAVAIGLVGNSVAQFAKHRPSTGSFVTFIGAGFGPYAAIVTSVFLTIGYAIGFGAIVGISGGWSHVVIQKYLSIDVPWQLLTAILTLGALALMTLGANISTKWAAISFGAEMLLLLVVSVALLIEHSSDISLKPFSPGSITSLSGFGLAFPLAVYLFVGWENSAAMAEEAKDPRRAVGLAVFSSTAIMGVTYVLLTFATLVAFGQNVKGATSDSVPFVSAADSVLGVFAVLAYLAGVTSILGCLIGAANAQARIIFNSAREGMLPSWLGAVHPTRRTPAHSLTAYCLVTLAIVYAFGWNTDPFVFFGEIATLGTIPLAFVYLATNLALVAFAKRHLPRANPLTHYVLPVLGVAAIGYPLYQIIKPGQPAPFNRYPLVALGLFIFALVYAAVLYRRDATLGERIGSVVADQD